MRIQRSTENESKAEKTQFPNILDFSWAGGPVKATRELIEESRKTVLLPLASFSHEHETPNKIIQSSHTTVKSCQKAIRLTATTCTHNLKLIGHNLNFQDHVHSATKSFEETAASCQKNITTLSESLSANGQFYHKRFTETATNCHANLAQFGDMLQSSITWEKVQEAARNQRGTFLEKDALGSELVSVREAYNRQIKAQAEQHRDLEDLYTFNINYCPTTVVNKNKGTSSLRDRGRKIAIVTTASLPWMTGTAVNPLLRAAYLSRDESRKITLVIPWLSKVDQKRIFPKGISFDTPEEQEKYVREWVEERTGLKSNFKVSFYTGRYAEEKCSILPVGDLTECIPDHEADVAVLEEPEHLNWYHHGRRWTDKFNHVVGIMHTNYLEYAKHEEGGILKKQLLRRVNQWVTRAYCHHVIKLSDAVQSLPREKTMFIHGVSPAFLEIGKKKANITSDKNDDSYQERFSKGVYFIAKVLWAKGYRDLLDIFSEYNKLAGKSINIDIYGNGDDFSAVKEEANRLKLAMKFFGARDHADSSIEDYKVFVNPSLSDVVATTTAEALAMGKFVVCPEHPSNVFFSTFTNCMIYKTPEEFKQCIDKALCSDPKPLSTEETQRLTWEAATERFLDVSELKEEDRTKGFGAVFDTVCWALHNVLSGIEPVRIAVGAGINTKDTPQRVIDYDPAEADCNGGFFDRK